MSSFKPGDFRITDRAMEIWALPKDSEVLDIGCGQGEAVEYLQDHYGFKTSGIDVSTTMIKEGLERNPKLNIKFGDGEFLENYSSYSFDGVMMECVLSLVNIPDEALHEVYCVLKKGGKLFISDLYIKDPDPQFVLQLAVEAERLAKLPHGEGDCASHSHEEGDNEQDDSTHCTHDCNDCSLDCGDDCTHEEEDHDMGEDSDYYKKEHQKKAVKFRSESRFVLEPLIQELQEIGYKNIHWEDFSVELDNFVAQKLMDRESLKDCFCDESLKPNDTYKTGYFLLTAEKPI